VKKKADKTKQIQQGRRKAEDSYNSPYDITKLWDIFLSKTIGSYDDMEEVKTGLAKRMALLDHRSLTMYVCMCTRTKKPDCIVD